MNEMTCSKTSCLVPATGSMLKSIGSRDALSAAPVVPSSGQAGIGFAGQHNFSRLGIRAQCTTLSDMKSREKTRRPQSVGRKKAEKRFSPKVEMAADVLARLFYQQRLRTQGDEDGSKTADRE
jgi:hypothetical protein